MQQFLVPYLILSSLFCCPGQVPMLLGWFRGMCFFPETMFFYQSNTDFPEFPVAFPVIPLTSTY